MSDLDRLIHTRLKVYKVCINDDPLLTLTNLTAVSNLAYLLNRIRSIYHTCSNKCTPRSFPNKMYIRAHCMAISVSERLGRCINTFSFKV